MELTKQVKIVLDSQDYKNLFEPSSKVDWLSSEVEELSNAGDVEFYHSAACMPYYVLYVNQEDLKDLLKALYDHVIHCLQPEIYADVDKYHKGDVDDDNDKWESNHDINTSWSVDSFEELEQVKQSIDKLEDDVYKNLCLAKKGLI
ncbi:hypothetical protein vBAbaMD22_145 [Acinetobacter phage vB_AbaM_D22]|nr:hypothetical protein vBAbaMD22_145 [Acinetobacter phage vB_AbaM_D22]